MKAIIICANGVEECEALLTYDLLSRANIETYLVGFDKNIVSSHNVKFETNLLLEEINPDDYDCLILPGGLKGTENLENSKLVQDLIDKYVKDDKYVCAVCAAPSILLHKGLLRSNEFTCFPGFESGYISTNEKCHQDGKFITGKGLGATIEFAAKIIENLTDKETSANVLNKIQY